MNRSFDALVIRNYEATLKTIGEKPEDKAAQAAFLFRPTKNGCCLWLADGE